MSAYSREQQWADDQMDAEERAGIFLRYKHIHRTLGNDFIELFLWWRDRLLKTDLVEQQGRTYINTEIDRYINGASFWKYMNPSYYPNYLLSIEGMVYDLEHPNDDV